MDANSLVQVATRSSVLALYALAAGDSRGNWADRYVDAFAAEAPRPFTTAPVAGVRLVSSPCNLPGPARQLNTGPFVSHDDRLHLLWDGRLDNDEELASELGMSRTAAAISHPAIVFAAFEAWGDSFVEHLIGDWALILWDGRIGRLLAAKDPLGWRPLFYSTHRGVLALTSDPRTLRDAGVPWAPNYDFVYRYLANATQEPGPTAYRHVSRLDGGQRLLADATGWRVETYWGAPRIRQRNYKDPLDYVEEFEHLTAHAVRAMLRGPGRPAILLSGGLDSSYVATVAARQQPNLLAVSSYAPNTAWDEREYQRLVLDHTGLDSISIDITTCTALDPDLAPDALFDTPAVPPQHAMHRYMDRAVADTGATVVLTGVGGDEWLTGDARYVADAVLSGHPRRAWKLARLSGRRPRPVRAIATSLYKGVVPRGTRAALAGVRGGAYWDGLLPLVKPDPGWEGPAIRDDVVLRRPAEVLRRRWRAYRNDTQGTIEWRDRHSQRPAGIEFRSPLNDLRVVEFLAGVPDWVKRYRGNRKDILRTALRREGLPLALYGRLDKASYDEPYDAGVRVENRARAERAIDAVCRLPGVDSQQVQLESGEWLRGETQSWEATWRIVSAGLWLQCMDAPISADSVRGHRLAALPLTAAQAPESTTVRSRA